MFSSAADSLAGVVVVHTLKFTYMTQHEPREFYIALDDDDLETLQKVISRAQAKSKILNESS